MTYAAALTTEEFEALRSLASAPKRVAPLQDEIRDRLISLGLIEEKLGGYAVTSRGHARILSAA